MTTTCGELPNAKEIRAHAANWLQRRHFSSWNSEDQAALDDWLEESPTHMTAYLRVSAAWENAGRLSALRTVRRNRQLVFYSNRSLSRYVGIAAAALVALYAGRELWPSVQPPIIKSYATGLGGHETLKLADGSQIELNTDTRLRILITPNQRKVWLDKGEAYFQVHHELNRAFVVQSNAERILDLGTKFTVRRDAKGLQVGVVEGRVQFETAAAGVARKISLSAGDVAVSTSGSIAMAKKPMAELIKDLGWRNGVLIFENVTLAEAAAEFNRYNAEKVVVVGKDVEHLTIGGKFAQSDVPAFAELAQHVLGLRVEDRGGVTVISR